MERNGNDNCLMQDQTSTGVAAFTISSWWGLIFPLNFLSKFSMNSTAREARVSSYSTLEFQPFQGVMISWESPATVWGTSKLKYLNL